jgi:hypothetical protein
MKTSLEIINRIESKKVELGMNVELATAKDLLALYGKAVSLSNKLLGNIPPKIDLLKKELITLEKESVKLISDLDGSLIDYEKITKELGLQATQNKNYVDAKKELEDLYKGTSYITRIIQVLK